MKRINTAGIVLLLGGIAIGIALTMLSVHVVAPATQTATNSPHKLIAEKSPPGAADAQTAPPEAQAPPEQSPADQSVEGAAAPAEPAEPQAPADWLKPQDLATKNGAAPSAVPAAPQYQSSHTEYYIYPTGPTGPVSYPTNMATPESGYLQPNTPVMIGENGLVQNPCVDPPSVRGRAYRH